MNQRSVVSQLKKLGVSELSPMRNPKGKIFAYWCLVPLSVCKLAAYQRSTSEAHCDLIGGDDFDYRACDPLSLSLRALSLWNYDGGHRAKVMIEKGMTHHYAIVQIGLTYAQEAKLFFLKNDRHRKMAGWVKFKAAINANDPVRKELLQIATKHRLTTPCTVNMARVADCDIKSAEYLLWPYKKGGMVLVDVVCRVLSECWRASGPKSRLRADAKEIGLIRGLTSFLKQHYLCGGGLPWDTIRMVLSKFTPTDITELAKKKPAKRTDQAQFHEVLCEVFNRSRKITSPCCHQRRAA